MCGLWLNAHRVEVRHSYRVVRGVLDATDEVHPSYFDALCDTPEEGAALYNMHRNRVRSAGHSGEVPVDGGGG